MERGKDEDESISDVSVIIQIQSMHSICWPL